MVLIDHGKVMFDGALDRVVEQFSANKIEEANFYYLAIFSNHIFNAS